MSDRSPIFPEVALALREHGLTAAVTALVGGVLALAAAVTRRAFTNEALLQRLERELITERDRIEAQRAEDRKVDADRLARMVADINAMRRLMFDALQRGRDST